MKGTILFHGGRWDVLFQKTVRLFIRNAISASVNGLSVNGLSVNGLSGNGLSANGLSANGLSANGFYFIKLILAIFYT